jgi:hypothetical protein
MAYGDDAEPPLAWLSRWVLQRAYGNKRDALGQLLANGKALSKHGEDRLGTLVLGGFGVFALPASWFYFQLFYRNTPYHRPGGCGGIRSTGGDCFSFAWGNIPFDVGIVFTLTIAAFFIGFFCIGWLAFLEPYSTIQPADQHSDVEL